MSQRQNTNCFLHCLSDKGKVQFGDFLNLLPSLCSYLCTSQVIFGQSCAGLRVGHLVLETFLNPPHHVVVDY